MENPERVRAAPASVAVSRSPGADWAAILAGAALAAAAGLIFNTFGAAIGLSTVSAEAGEGSFTLWMIVTAVWIVVSLVAAYMAGGYVAGRMRRRSDDITDDEATVRDGLHGLVVWALGTLVTAWIAVGAVGMVAQTAGNMVGAVAETAGTALTAGVEAAGSAVAGIDDVSVGWINDSLGRANPSATGAAEDGIDRTELLRQSASILTNVAGTGSISDEDRQFLAAATAQITGLSVAEAEARVDDAVASAMQLRTQAEELAATAEAEVREAAERARIAAILTAFGIAAATLAAAAASVAGGVYGGHHRDEGRMFAGLGFRR